MNNKQRQEIIDYLEQGEKYTKVLLRELNRADITDPEKRTYSSLLDALSGATELYCYMTEWDDNIEVFIPNQKQECSLEDYCLIVEHGPHTLEIVKVVSDFVIKLPLSNELNDNLIKLMTDQLLVAEHEQYMSGFNDCMKAIQSGGFSGTRRQDCKDEWRIDKLIKIKVSYEHEQELQGIITRLGPNIKSVKPSKNNDGKYKKAYIYLVS